MEESQHRPDEGLGIQWLDYLPALWKYRWVVGGVCIASVLYGVIPLLLSPSVYEARATILRVSGGGDGLNLLTLLVQQAGINRGAASPGRGDSVLSILRSRTMSEEVAKKMELEKYYKVSRLQDAAAILNGRAKSIASKEGIIEIKVEDKSPQKAADIANSYAENLNLLVTRLGAGAAGRQRLFVAERLKETESALRKNEEALKSFQEKNRAVVIPVQTTEAISAAATLRAQLINAEIQLQQVRSFATESNPEVVRLKRTIAEYKRQIGQAQYGAAMDLPPDSQKPGQSQKDIYLPAVKVPETILEFTRLAREVKVQESVYMLLIQQLEQAKISELQDALVVQLLDPALPPEAPKPLKIGQMAALYGALGIFAGVLMALVFDYTTCNWSEMKSRILSSIHPSDAK